MSDPWDVFAICLLLVMYVLAIVAIVLTPRKVRNSLMPRNTPPKKPSHPLLQNLRDRLTRIVPWKPKDRYDTPSWDTVQKNRRAQLREEFAGYTLAEIDAAIDQQYGYMLEVNREADRAKELWHDMLSIKRGY